MANTELVHTINKILLKDWQPIPFIDPNDPAFNEEYLCYAHELASMISARADTVAIAKQLEEFRTVFIGLSPEPTRDRKVATLLVHLP